MHRVIHLDALPAMIIVVFVKNEIHVGPLGGEETVEALLVRQVHQLVDLPPVVPLETPVEFRIAFQGRILVHKLAIRDAWTTRAAQRHVVVSLVSFGRVVIDVERGERFGENARKIGLVFVERRHGIQPADGHFARAVVIEVEEGKRVFPVQARIGKRLRRPVNFQKQGIAVVVGEPVATARVGPVVLAEIKRGPIEVAEHAVFFDVDEDHPV